MNIEGLVFEHMWGGWYYNDFAGNVTSTRDANGGVGTKEWLKDNSTKETKEVQNRDKVIMKDQEIGSYGVGSELLDEFNSRVLSATVVDKNKRKIATCKKE